MSSYYIITAPVSAYLLLELLSIYPQLASQLQNKVDWIKVCDGILIFPINTVIRKYRAAAE